MPEAVELISRALRAGHGLASGLHLVAEEMKGPIADEFNRVFEEQNLGIPIELSLRNMADRIPVMDVRFFVIAIIIQRATGGDLAEVLDKIGRLIRQRFELLGHVKALTAEGRLSGIVLLALPPGLLAFLSFSNYDYISPLFTTSVGTKMLMATGGHATAGRLDDQEDRGDQGVNYRASNSRRLASLPGFSVDHAGGLGDPVGAGRPQGWRRGPPSPDHEPGDRPERGRRAGGWPAGEVPGPGDQGREQAGPVAASLRRGRARQGPAQAAQRRIPQRERGGRSLRHQADPHAPGLGDRLSDRWRSSSA